MADISGYLNNIKSAESGETVRDSIIQCLNKINNDNPNKTKPLNVTANGTYTSETGFSYNPVTVNVPSGGASGYTFEELEVTENGEYEPDEDNKMFNKVTVNVPQLAKDLAPDGYTITQNGEYDPLLDGYDGYGKIIVNVNEATGDGPFTVQFYKLDGTVGMTDTVPKYGSTYWNFYDGKTQDGQYFKGWNPPPTNVTRDLKCYPVFGEYIIDPSEIPDSWETICQNGGAPYPLGSYKALVLNNEIFPEVTLRVKWYHDTIDKVYAAKTSNTVFHMVKVAEGESGSTSTWISTGGVTVTDSSGADYFADWDWYGSTVAFWSNSGIRQWLNSSFISVLPECLKTNIKTVEKVSQIYNGAWMDETTMDKIWIPSIKELSALADAMSVGNVSTTRRESSGIDYSLVYVPNMSGILTRSMAGGEGNPIANLNKTSMQIQRSGITAWRNTNDTNKYQIGFCL